MYLHRRKLLSHGLKAALASGLLGSSKSIAAEPAKGDRKVSESFLVHLQLKFEALKPELGFLDFDQDTLKWEDKNKFLSTIDLFQKQGLMAYTCRLRTEKSYFTKSYFFKSLPDAEKFYSTLLSNGSIRLKDLENASYKLNPLFET